MIRLKERLLTELYIWGPLTSKELASITKSDLQTVRTTIQKLEKRKLITEMNKKIQTKRGRPEFLYTLTSNSKNIISKFLIRIFLERKHYKVEYEKKIHMNSRIDVFGEREYEKIGVEIKFHQIQWSFLKYKKHLNKLYLALPKHSINSKILTKCKNEGVGILQLDHNVKEILKPLRFEFIERVSNNLVKKTNMKLELKIVGLLAGDVKMGYTINGISKELGDFYSQVHRTVNRMTENNVIMQKRIGKSNVCSLNVDSEEALALLLLYEIEKRKELFKENKQLGLVLDDFIKTMKSKHKSIESIVLFGSNAKGTATEDSDIDVLVMSKAALSIEKDVKEIHAKYGKVINPVIMPVQDFVKQQEKAVIKEVIKDHIVLYGTEHYINAVFSK